MNARPEVVEVLRQWVRKAEHDLEAADRIMAIEEGCPFDTVCFHCQQAAEKYLKCLLTCLGIQAPRTHDLKVDVRYADDWREPQLSEAKRALALASRVRAAVRELMPPAVVG